MKKYNMVITNGSRIEYKTVTSKESFAMVVKMENGLLNTEWHVREELSFEITEAMQQHFELVKEYRELEEEHQKAWHLSCDAQFYFSSQVVEAMETELDAIKDRLKAAKAKMNESLRSNEWSQAEKRGMKKMYDGMNNITAGEL